MLAIHRRVVVAEAMRVRVCRSELTFSHFTTRFQVSSTSEASIVLHQTRFLQWGNRLSQWVPWFLVSRLGPRLLLVSAPVVAMPDDDQLSDLALSLIHI